jgi:hypothetical protein
MNSFSMAAFLVRLYPPAWRRQHEDELLDLLRGSPIRVSDLLDLARCAAGEWERHLLRASWRAPKILAVAYGVLLVTWAATELATNVFAVTALSYGRGVGLLVQLPVVAVLFMLPMFVVALVCSLPILALIAFAGRRVPVGIARSVGALVLTAWAQWMLVRLEWADVWRHGTPEAGYWITVLLPYAAAFASAGAVLGGALAQRDGQGPRITPLQ